MKTGYTEYIGQQWTIFLIKNYENYNLICMKRNQGNSL